MTESEKVPGIHELTDDVYEIARQFGWHVPPDLTSRTLIVHANGGPEKTREAISGRIVWTPDEYAVAGFLAKQVDRMRGGEPLEVPPPNLDFMKKPARETENNVQPPRIARPRRWARVQAAEVGPTTQTERSNDPNWRKLTKGLDTAFNPENGGAENWLSGKDPEAADKFRSRIRESVGLDDSDNTGLLMVAEEAGGVGFSFAQARIMGIGLGYQLDEENGQPIRRDSENPPSFDQRVQMLKANGIDIVKFHRRYVAALQKLLLFGEQKRHATQQRPSMNE